jgi:hypothetical protein
MHVSSSPVDAMEIAFILSAATCRHCGYSLHRLVENRCPECGNSFDPQDPKTFRLPRSIRRHVYPGLSLRTWSRRPAIQVGMLALVAAGILMLDAPGWDHLTPILSVYGAFLWLSAIAGLAIYQFKHAFGRDDRFALTMTITLLVATALQALRFDSCPHARYVYFGTAGMAITGHACDNERHPVNIIEWLYDH